MADHPVGPGEDLAPVLLRHAEQFADRLQRQLRRDVRDEVAGTGFQRGRHDALGAHGEGLAQVADGPGGEPAGDDAAQLGVFGRVDVEQDEPLHLDRLAGHAVGEADQRGVLPGRVDLRRFGDRDDVGVPGDRPVPVVVEPGRSPALRDPPDRGRAAQLGQFLGRHPGGVDLGVGEVKARRDVRSGHGCLPWPLVERVLVLIRPRIAEVSHELCGNRRDGADPGRNSTGRSARATPPGPDRACHGARRNG